MKPDRAAMAAIAVGALLAFGIAVRIALQVPLHRWANEGDCVTIAFGAWEILAGDLRIFVSTGYRQGALSCYLAAAASLFVGPGRAALALEVCMVGIAQIFVWWLALLELTGWKARSAGSARLLVFIVLPSPAVFYWGIYWPTGYPEIFLAAMLVLWAGARFWRRGGAFDHFALAVASGLAFWMSMLTLAITIPVCAWLTWQRGRDFLASRRILPFVAGGLLGGLPWIAFNLRYSWVSLQSNWAARPASGPDAVLDNAGRYFGEVLPTLWGAMSQAGYVQGATGLQRLLGGCAIVLVGLTLAILLNSAVRAQRSWGTESASPGRTAPAVEWLPLLALAAVVVAISAALFIFSAAGSMGGNVVRYSLPVFLVWPLWIALAWEFGGKGGRAGLAVLAVVVLAGYAAAVPWPWTSARTTARADLATEKEMIAHLEAKGVQVVFGSFWEAYPLIFESGGRLGGSTLEWDYDFHRFGSRLPAGPCRWAVVARARGDMRFVGKAGYSGERVPFGRNWWLFIPGAASADSSAPTDCAETLAILRSGFRG